MTFVQLEKQAWSCHRLNLNTVNFLPSNVLLSIFYMLRRRQSPLLKTRVYFFRVVYGYRSHGVVTDRLYSTSESHHDNLQLPDPPEKINPDPEPKLERRAFLSSSVLYQHGFLKAIERKNEHFSFFLSFGPR